MSADLRERLEIVDAYWAQLRAVDDRLLRRARAREARRRLRRTLAIAVLALLLLAAAAVAARALIFGDDVPRRLPMDARSLGGIEPGSSRVLAVRERDPDGGPPWGVRAFRTRSGAICLAPGRVVDGELVALGVAGAFANDGKAHRLPLEAEDCGGPTVGGAAVIPALARSAYVNERIELGEGCLLQIERRALDRRPAAAREAIRAARARGDAATEARMRRVLGAALRALQDVPETCPDSDLRSLVFGLAGTQAVAVTVDGVEHAVDPREQGSYLFVLAGEHPLGPKSIAVRLASGTVCEIGNPLRRQRTTLTRECIEARAGKP